MIVGVLCSLLIAKPRFSLFPFPPYWLVAICALAFGMVLFLWELGAIGLVDETPPLFASSARRMLESGDWLVPHVNGLPRYDKPPLLYWLMAIAYAAFAQNSLDPLGSFAAALPSALSAMLILVLLALALAWWERATLPHSMATWLVAPLLFGLSPLVLVWGRIGVSDMLLSALLAGSLLSGWACWAGLRAPWWLSWMLLSLAVLTKGPVAVILFAFTWLLFVFPSPSRIHRLRRLRPLLGTVVLFALSLPWYLLVLWRDGDAFLTSFFGYHNFQRFTQVVNHHQSPWWLYLAMLAVASLPWSPRIVVALWQSVRAPIDAPHTSLPRFCASWLFAVLLFFTASATKLPSYWLPAVPATALILAFDCGRQGTVRRNFLRSGMIISFALGLTAWLAPLWLPWIDDPDLISLPQRLSALHLPLVVGLILCGGVALAWLLQHFSKKPVWSVLLLQCSWLLLVPLAYLPMLRLGDALRSAPLRHLALLVRSNNADHAPVVALGAPKPSLHFYTQMPVAYEGASAQAMVNLNHRLKHDPRVRVPSNVQSVLLIAPLSIGASKLWRPLLDKPVHHAGRYGLWHVPLTRLDQRASKIAERQSVAPTWFHPRPERF